MAPSKKTTATGRIKKTKGKKIAAKKVPGPQSRAQELLESGFLDLAPETRNEIYGMWAQDIHQVGIRPKGKAHTIANHPITQISRQVHKEFCGFLGATSVVTADRIKAKVVDLDFYSLITYLNRVIASPEANYHDFKENGDARSLIVELSFTSEFWKNPPVDKVAKWFRFLAKSVPGLEFTMRIAEVADEAKTSEAMSMMMFGRELNGMWTAIMRVYREWGAARQEDERMRDFMARLVPQPKTAMEQAVDDYYNNIYAEMDARRARAQQADVDADAEVKEESEVKADAEEWVWPEE